MTVSPVCRQIVRGPLIEIPGPEVFPGLGRDNAEEPEEGDEVRGGHQPVRDVCERPDRRERCHGADHDRSDPEPAVGLHGAHAEEVFARLFSVVGPTDKR